MGMTVEETEKLLTKGFSSERWIAVGFHVSHEEMYLIEEKKQWCKEHTTTFLHIQFISGGWAIARFAYGPDAIGKTAKLDAMHFKLRYV